MLKAARNNSIFFSTEEGCDQMWVGKLDVLPEIGGVRPSSGAATHARLEVGEVPQAFRTFHLAVAGDGHTPDLTHF